MFGFHTNNTANTGVVGSDPVYKYCVNAVFIFLWYLRSVQSRLISEFITFGKVFKNILFVKNVISDKILFGFKLHFILFYLYLDERVKKNNCFFFKTNVHTY